MIFTNINKQYTHKKAIYISTIHLKDPKMAVIHNINSLHIYRIYIIII